MRLVLVHRHTIDFGAIRATLISQRIIVVPHANDGCVEPGYCQVFEKDITFPATPDAERFFTYVVDAPWLLALFDAHEANALRAASAA